MPAVACCARRAARPGETLCPTCAPTRCGTCHYLRGQHAPSCRAGFCHGCGERTATGTKFFCAACRAAQCPECRHYAGQHGPRCRYAVRQRRPARTTAFHVTTADHVIALFNASHAKAVRHAQYVADLSRPQAEDVVSEVFLWIWAHRDYFPTPPGPALLFTVVGRAALRVHRYAWARYVVLMDPPTLVLAEQATYDPTQPALAVPV